MPLAAVLLVLVSVATLLLYVLPAAKARLSGYAEDRAVAQAVAAANAAADSEGSDLQRQIDLVADSEGGEVLIVDTKGQVVAQAGEHLLSSPPEKILQRAANGERMNDTIGGQRVAVVPLVQGGEVAGGVVFAPGDSENVL